jgi:hypothetical protein
MIIWGSGGASTDLGVISTESCKTCEKDRPFKIFLNYQYSHLYWCRWVTKREYIKACDVCRRGWSVDEKKMEAVLSKDPIPFGTRYGALILFGIIILLVGVGYLNR